MLLVVCGLQGTGKTTVAKKIAGKINAAILRTDVVRKELIKESKYTKEEKRIIYEKLFSKAKNLLKENKSVVLDATFDENENRALARKISEEFGTGFKIVEIICLEELVKKRLKKRTFDESDADFKVHMEHKDSFEPITEPHIIIDNSKDLKHVDSQLNEHF